MKFYGMVGFWEGDREIDDDIWSPKIVERRYTGEILRNYRKTQTTQNQNDDLTVNAQISILSDLYAQQNWHSIRYVIWNDAKWKVTNVDVSYPRLVLELGGVYRGSTSEGTE